MTFTPSHGCKFKFNGAKVCVLSDWLIWRECCLSSNVDEMRNHYEYLHIHHMCTWQKGHLESWIMSSTVLICRILSLCTYYSGFLWQRSSDGYPVKEFILTQVWANVYCIAMMMLILMNWRVIVMCLWDRHLVEGFILIQVQANLYCIVMMMLILMNGTVNKWNTKNECFLEKEIPNKHKMTLNYSIGLIWFHCYFNYHMLFDSFTHLFPCLSKNYMVMRNCGHPPTINKLWSLLRKMNSMYWTHLYG